MKSKKSQGQSIGVIITAVIALIVLVVLIAIFVSTTEKTTENLRSCLTKGGMCANVIGGSCNDEYPIPIIVGNCEGSTANNLCCLKAEN